MSGDKSRKISLNSNQIFKLNESNKDRDYLANKRRYLLLEQLSSSVSLSDSKPIASTSITNTIAGSQIDSSPYNGIQKCTKDALSPSTTSAASNLLPFAGLRPFYPIHPSSYPYSLLSTSEVPQFSPW